VSLREPARRVFGNTDDDTLQNNTESDDSEPADNDLNFHVVDDVVVDGGVAQSRRAERGVHILLTDSSRG